jgi:nicotinate phosphoribosyltransferase
VYGERSTFLIDTYDTLEAARRIVASGLRPAAVRLDSGDLGAHSREVRRIFDAGGLSHTRVLVSGDLDEWAIADLVAQEAPIDGFGVGTALSTSKDAPALGGIYKLVEVERSGETTPVMKLSGGKASYPGRKQVWRHVAGGRAHRDTIALDHEPGYADGHALLEPVMLGGRRVAPSPALETIRRRHQAAIALLPDALRALDPPIEYTVAPSRALEDLTARTLAALTGPAAR